jgi:antirestriction protein ArdC
MSQTLARLDPYQLVTESILKQLGQGVVPWRCPWNRTTGRPRNFHTGREYQGLNILLLGMMQFSSPWWMTFRQTQERGGLIRKGEHATIVVKWGRAQKTLTQNNGHEEKPFFFLKSYRVFNAVQIEGVEFPSVETCRELDSSLRIARAEQIVAEMPNPPRINEGRNVKACYRPGTDTIEMPPFGRFHGPEAFHLTLFHELIHATGHVSRLGRKAVCESVTFGEEAYSQEELVAEMGAAFLGMEADIVVDQHEQSAAYLKGWLNALGEKEHRRWIIQAAGQAGRAADYILKRHIVDPMAGESLVV